MTVHPFVFVFFWANHLLHMCNDAAMHHTNVFMKLLKRCALPLSAAVPYATPC